MVILELIHASKSRLLEGMYLLDKKPTPAMASLVIHNNFSNRVYRDGSFKFLPYQLSMVG